MLLRFLTELKPLIETKRVAGHQAKRARKGQTLIYRWNGRRVKISPALRRKIAPMHLCGFICKGVIQVLINATLPLCRDLRAAPKNRMRYGKTRIDFLGFHHKNRKQQHDENKEKPGYTPSKDGGVLPRVIAAKSPGGLLAYPMSSALGLCSRLKIGWPLVFLHTTFLITLLHGME